MLDSCASAAEYVVQRVLPGADVRPVLDSSLKVIDSGCRRRMRGWKCHRNGHMAVTKMRFWLSPAVGGDTVPFFVIST